MPRASSNPASHRQRFAKAFAVALACLAGMLWIFAPLSGARAAEAPPGHTMDHGGGAPDDSQMSGVVPEAADPIPPDSNGPSGEHSGHTPGMNMDQTVTTEAADADEWTTARSAVIITFAAINIAVLIAAAVARSRRRPPPGRRRRPVGERDGAASAGGTTAMPEVAR